MQIQKKALKYKCTVHKTSLQCKFQKKEKKKIKSTSVQCIKPVYSTNQTAIITSSCHRAMRAAEPRSQSLIWTLGSDRLCQAPLASTEPQAYFFSVSLAVLSTVMS